MPSAFSVPLTVSVLFAHTFLMQSELAHTARLSEEALELDTDFADPSTAPLAVPPAGAGAPADQAQADKIKQDLNKYQTVVQSATHQEEAAEEMQRKETQLDNKAQAEEKQSQVIKEEAAQTEIGAKKEGVKKVKQYASVEQTLKAGAAAAGRWVHAAPGKAWAAGAAAAAAAAAAPANAAAWAGRAYGHVTGGIGSAWGHVTGGIGSAYGHVTGGIGSAYGHVTGGIGSAWGHLMGTTPTHMQKAKAAGEDDGDEDGFDVEAYDNDKKHKHNSAVLWLAGTVLAIAAACAGTYYVHQNKPEYAGVAGAGAGLLIGGVLLYNFVLL